MVSLKAERRKILLVLLTDHLFASEIPRGVLRILFLSFKPQKAMAGSREKYIIFLVHACILSHFSRVQFFETLWTVVCQAPLSMGFCRQEYWSGLPVPLPRDLPNPGIESTSLMSPASPGGFLTTSTICEAP